MHTYNMRLIFLWNIKNALKKIYFPKRRRENREHCATLDDCRTN
uniref:Uncharacterized protein n=1 Tax=Arundo donax TaxID=35708 RepID=A0A0A8XRY9_ARUDO